MKPKPTVVVRTTILNRGPRVRHPSFLDATSRCWLTGVRASHAGWRRRAARRATRDLARERRGRHAARPHARDARVFRADRADDSRLARAYLRVLFGRPLFFLYRRVDLVAPPLRALLAGLPGELRGDERPSVAVNFLETEGRKDWASASGEMASHTSVASRVSARGNPSNNCHARSVTGGEKNKMKRVKALLERDAPATARVPRLPRRSTPMSSCHR